MSMPAPPPALSALRLPIHFETLAGFGEAGGMLSFDGRGLKVEFQTRDAMFGLALGGAKAINLPLYTIDEVRSGAGWFWLMPWIEFALNDFPLLNALPGAQGGRWRARVRFADRAALRRFAAALAFARAEALHTRLSEGLGAGVEAPATLPGAGESAARQGEPRRRELE